MRKNCVAGSIGQIASYAVGGCRSNFLLLPTLFIEFSPTKKIKDTAFHGRDNSLLKSLFNISFLFPLLKTKSLPNKQSTFAKYISLCAEAEIKLFIIQIIKPSLVSIILFVDALC